MSCTVDTVLQVDIKFATFRKNIRISVFLNVSIPFHLTLYETCILIYQWHVRFYPYVLLQVFINTPQSVREKKSEGFSKNALLFIQTFFTIDWQGQKFTLNFQCQLLSKSDCKRILAKDMSVVGWFFALPKTHTRFHLYCQASFWGNHLFFMLFVMLINAK